ncbi:MAG: hypothetical protein SH850_24920 [Planctomycetaceae bacterium]|nr:hypothetical protein [Planctomycetaceae bacterium]
MFTAVLVAQANLNGWAQDSDRAERTFDSLDRDKDGEIDDDEFRRMDDRMRDRFRDKGLDGNRDISKSRFLDTYRRIEEDRRKEDEGRRDGDSRSSSSSGSSSDRDRGRSSSSRRKEKIRLTLALPAKYLAFDKNKDDQIGMYEWDKAKFAEFVALDRNGDGFLTPNELDDPAKATAATAVGSAAKPGAPAVAGKPAVNAAMSPDKPANNDDPDTRQAKYFFSLTDKDKNGEISAEEWTASRGIRPMFEKASVVPALPLKEAGFVQQYLAVKQKK